MLRFIIAVIGMIAVGWLVWRLLQQQEAESSTGGDDDDDASNGM